MMNKLGGKEMITLQNVTGGYSSAKAIVHNVSFSVEKGCFFALLGPNGSGKTTIIRLIMGVLTKHSGTILIDGKKVESYRPKDLAQKVAVMTQENDIGLDFSVEDIVSLGRYAYRKAIFFQERTTKDVEVIESVMRQTGIFEYRNRLYSSLSGGEKQRVLLAKALAQQPKILLLDEPTNHLDIRHTLELLDLLKQLQEESGLTIMAILHDLNIASLYADQMGLLNGGHMQGIYEQFTPQNEKEFSEVYNVQIDFQVHPTIPKNQVVLSPRFLTSGKESKQRSSFSLFTENGRRVVVFPTEARTLSVGENGEGFKWSNKWIITSEEVQAMEAKDISFYANNTVPLYIYNKDCRKAEIWQSDLLLNEKASCVVLIHKSDVGVQVGIIVNTKQSDVQLINLSMEVTAFLRELQRNEHDTVKQQLPIIHLAISCLNKDNNEENASVISDVLQTIKRAWV